MTLTITTDRKWRNLRYSHEVPDRVMNNRFNYLTGEALEGESFFKYRGWWYCLADFMPCNMPELTGWHGYHSDSFYSGIVITLSKDGEQYQAGTFIS